MPLGSNAGQKYFNCVEDVINTIFCHYFYILCRIFWTELPSSNRTKYNIVRRRIIHVYPTDYRWHQLFLCCLDIEASRTDISVILYATLRR